KNRAHCVGSSIVLTPPRQARDPKAPFKAVLDPDAPATQPNRDDRYRSTSGDRLLIGIGPDALEQMLRRRQLIGIGEQQREQEIGLLQRQPGQFSVETAGSGQVLRPGHRNPHGAAVASSSLSNRKSVSPELLRMR